MMEKKPTLPPFLIVGRKNSGKTHFLRSTAARLRSQGLKVGGFVSVGEFTNGAKNNYYLQDLETGNSKLLASTDSRIKHDAFRQGRYFFDPEIFEWANQTLINKSSYDAIIIDEYGPLESREKGLFPSFDFLVRNHRGSLFVSVRPALVSQLCNLLEKYERFERIVIHLNSGRTQTSCIVAPRKSGRGFTGLFEKGIERLIGKGFSCF